MIPFLSPIGSKSTTRIKPAAAKNDILDFAEKFGKFFGEGFTRVRVNTEYLIKGDEGADPNNN
jgi:hypothetical protein